MQLIIYLAHTWQASGSRLRAAPAVYNLVGSVAGVEQRVGPEERGISSASRFDASDEYRNETHCLLVSALSTDHRNKTKAHNGIHR